MNKRKLITMLTALALVGAIGVGATLAYLSDSSKVLTNKFEFTEDGIDIGLDEAKIGENNKADPEGGRVDASEADKEQKYDNIIPGMEMDKDPTVTVKAGSLNCNVFVSVKNANAEEVLKINDLDTDAWKELTTKEVKETYKFSFTPEDENTKYYVYMGTKGKEELKENGDSFVVVPKAKTDVALEDVFQTLTVGTDVKKVKDDDGNDITFSAIVIKAAAVQADNCPDAEAAKAALDMLGATTTDITE